MKTQTFFIGSNEEEGFLPVARLSKEADGYSFCYTNGRKEISYGNPLKYQFPDEIDVYKSKDLFRFFQNRLMSPKRPDYGRYMKSLGLTRSATPFEVWSVTAGKRMTDSFEVFPKLVKDISTGKIRCNFLLETRTREHGLSEGDELFFQKNKHKNGKPPTVVDSKGKFAGYTPLYLSIDLIQVLEEKDTKYKLAVKRVSTDYFDFVLVELEADLNGHKIMEGYLYQPIEVPN